MTVVCGVQGLLCVVFRVFRDCCVWCSGCSGIVVCCVPGYTDLSLSDQVHLIECCWMELLLLNCAFRSMEHDGKHLVFAPDFHLDK